MSVTDLGRTANGPDHDIASLPRACAETCAMLRRADSVGVLRLESGAQMNMLPWLRPKTFHDLVIEGAIFRPGPIAGELVHPCLRRKVDGYRSPHLRVTLNQTSLG